MRYGLDKVFTIEGVDVTDEHRKEALALSDCEALNFLDQATQCVAPGLRKYGGTLGALMENFIASRGVIEEEMARVARRNLESVVSGSKAGRRVLNYAIAVAEKEALIVEQGEAAGAAPTTRVPLAPSVTPETVVAAHEPPPDESFPIGDPPSVDPDTSFLG